MLTSPFQRLTSAGHHVLLHADIYGHLGWYGGQQEPFNVPAAFGIASLPPPWGAQRVSLLP